MANKKLLHVENVNVLFEKIREVVSEKIPETVWLTTAKKNSIE